MHFGLCSLTCIIILLCIGFSQASPHLSECPEGYKYNHVKCIPVCENYCSSTQYCQKPNVCACRTGYHLLGEECHNDKEYCSLINYAGECLECHPNYSLTDNTYCLPICVQECTNGFCNKPNSCRCNRGYSQNFITGFCQPICQKSCGSNAFCSNDSNGLEYCACHQGYEKLNDICISLYSESSTLETTSLSEDDSTDVSITDVTSNSLKHSADFDDFLTSSTETSTLSEDHSEHNSNCKNGCWGGTCNEGICHCPQELFFNKATNDCVMPCENTCQNGVCNQENKCECNQGYVHQNGNGCVPQCDRECINSICVAPTHCECVEGDISNLNISSVHKCLPTCEGVSGKEGCLNGTCVAVNKCQCFDGFVPKSGDSFTCVLGFAKKDGWINQYNLLWLILLLCLLLLIAIGVFMYNLAKRVSYNVTIVEKQRYNYKVSFRKCKQPDCER